MLEVIFVTLVLGRGRDIFAAIATREWLNDSGFELQWMQKNFSSPHPYGRAVGFHPASFTMITASLLEVKRSRPGVGHPSPPSLKNKHGQIYTAIPSRSILRVDHYLQLQKHKNFSLLNDRSFVLVLKTSFFEETVSLRPLMPESVYFLSPQFVSSIFVCIYCPIHRTTSVRVDKKNYLKELIKKL